MPFVWLWLRDRVSGTEFLKDAKKGSLTRLLSEDFQGSPLLSEKKENPGRGAKLSYLTRCDACLLRSRKVQVHTGFQDSNSVVSYLKAYRRMDKLMKLGVVTFGTVLNKSITIVSAALQAMEGQWCAVGIL